MDRLGATCEPSGDHGIAQRRNLHLVCSPWWSTRQNVSEQGLNVTAQRLAVLRAVGGHPHLTVDEVVGVVRADIGSISRRAVYDAVGVLADTGLLRRIQPAGSAARDEDRVGDNHHHLICRGCGGMVDVDCAVGGAPWLTAADDAGYRIDEAEVIYWGQCPTCQQAGSAARRTPSN